MDLRGYYQRIRDAAASLDECVVVKSLATENGGVAGRLTEVSRGAAARLIVDGVAEPASPDEAEAYRADRAEARALEEERRRASQVQFQVISDADLRALMQTGRQRKG